MLLVDKTESEKNLLNSEIAIISQKLVDQQFQVNQLNDENVSYNFKILLTIVRKLVNILNKSSHKLNNYSKFLISTRFYIQTQNYLYKLTKGTKVILFKIIYLIKNHSQN